MKKVRTVVMLMISIIISVYLYMLVDCEYNYTIYQKIFMIIYFIVVVTLIHFILLKKTAEKEYCKTNRLLRLVIALSISVVLLIVLRDKVVPYYADNQTITINALGENNKESGSNEVRVSKLTMNEKEYPLDKIELTNNWSYDADNSQLVCYPDRKSPIYIYANNAESIEIEFIQHAWSGIAEVIAEHSQETMDLYSSENSVYKYEMVFESTTSRVQIVISYIGFCMIMMEALYFVSGYIQSKKSKIVMK